MKGISKFRKEHPNDRVEISATGETIDIALGELVKVSLKQGEFSSIEGALSFCLMLAGYETEDDSNSEQDVRGADSKTLSAPHQNEKHSVAKGLSPKPQADVDAKTDKIPAAEDHTVDAETRAAEGNSPVENCPLGGEDEKARALDTICQRRNGVELPPAMVKNIEGKRISDLERGFLRLLANSAKKGQSCWSDETIWAARRALEKE